MIQKAVLFDLDGTLIDTAPDFVRTINILCKKYNRPTPSDKEIREQVSAGARAMVRLMLGVTLPDDDPVLCAYRQEFLDVYECNICVDSTLFEGIDGLLEILERQGIAWGIVTNKPRHLAQCLLSALSLDKRCCVLVCPDDVIHTKPNPEPLLLACHRLHTLPSHCIYIGDHSRDIEAGRRAGMTTVVAQFGYLSKMDKPDKWGADFVTKTPNDLIKLLLSWVNNDLDE